MINLSILLLTALFWLLFMGRTVILMWQGVKVFVIAKGKRLREKLIELALVPLLILWSVQIVFTSLGKPLFGLPLLWDISAVQWIGLTLCAVGIVIFIAALISFGTAWRVGIDDKNSNRLVTTGMFKYSRNPIFLFMNMYFFGVFLVYPTLFFLLFSIGFSVGIHIQILNEERFLQSKFGTEYTEYRKRTRRYI